MQVIERQESNVCGGVMRNFLGIRSYESYMYDVGKAKGGIQSGNPDIHLQVINIKPCALIFHSHFPIPNE